MRREAALLALVLALALVGDASSQDASVGSTCSAINEAYSACYVQLMCSQCITQEGCEFDLMSLSCESSTLSTTGNGTTSTTTYCSSDDSKCSTCTVSTSSPTCTGEDGVCICPSMCTIVEPTNTDSCSTSSSAMSYTGVYVGVALGAISIILGLFIQHKWAERRRLRAMGVVRRELEAQRQLRRERRQRERELLRARRPELALDLTAWRDHIELHKPQMSKIELETCYYLMGQDKKEANAEAQQMDALSLASGDDDVVSWSALSNDSVSPPPAPAKAASASSPESLRDENCTDADEDEEKVSPSVYIAMQDVVEREQTRDGGAENARTIDHEDSSAADDEEKIEVHVDQGDSSGHHAADR